MNLLLFLLLVATGEAAYIASSIQQQSADGFQEQETAWQTRDDALRAESKQLLIAGEDLQKSLHAAEMTVNDLTAQLHGQKPAGEAPVAPASNPAPAVPTADQLVPAPTTSLGTFATTDGKKYENCQLLKVEAEAITFSHSEGISRVLYANLPTEMQIRFEVDPATETASPAAQTKYQNLIEQGAAGEVH